MRHSRLVKLWKRTSTIRKRPQVSSAGGEFSSFRLILCSHKTKRERNLHSDSPQAHGQAKSLKCFRLYCLFSSDFKSVFGKRSLFFFLRKKSWSLRTCNSNSHEAFFLCPSGDIRVLTVSAGHRLGMLASHSESHCAGPKTCAGSEGRVLLVSCTGCTAQQSHILRGSCWWRSASPHRPHCKEEEDNGHILLCACRQEKCSFWPWTKTACYFKTSWTNINRCSQFKSVLMAAHMNTETRLSSCTCSSLHTGHTWNTVKLYQADTYTTLQA